MGDLLVDLQKCTRCGFCQDVCPTYKAELNEGSVARGRLKLAKMVEEGKYRWDRDSKLHKHINDCLLCGACVSNCPGSIPVSEVMIKARQKINKQSGTDLFYKVAYKGALSDQKKLKLGRNFMRLYQITGVKRLVTATGILKAIPPLKVMEERMPEVPKKTFFEMLPDLVVQLQNPKYKVAYFCGCATNSFFGDVGAATVKVLQKLNCQVYAPTVECCGEPHKGAGDLEEAKRLAKRNIDIFFNEKNFDFIITDCATCGSALKNYKRLLGDDIAYQMKAEQFSAAVYDLNQFIVYKTDALENISAIDNQEITVTYHDPCHLVRGQKISEAPREILKKIPSVVLVEMEDTNSCCGGAGSYGFTHHRLSKKFLQNKMEKVKATGANCLATCCPACMMQLGYGIRSEQLNMKLVHPVQLLDKALLQTIADQKVEG